jgi:regulator of sigma E protease
MAGPLMNFLLAWVILWGLYFARGEAVVDTTQVVIGIVAPEGPASTAGIQEGDIIKSVNGTPVTTFSEMAEIISANPGREIAIVWEHDGAQQTAPVTTTIEEGYNNRGEKLQMGRIGVGQQVTYKSIGIHTAAWIGLSRAGEMAGMVFKFLYDVLTLRVSAKMIGGPVFIAQMAGQTAQAGLSALLFFIALLSVNLAVLNVLPIPVLDGGHLMFLAIEKLRGSPLSMRQRTVAQQVGMVFLLLLIVWVTYNDIMRFVTG